MKRWNMAMAMTLLFGFSFFGLRPMLAGTKGPFHTVESYTIYYGAPTEQALQRLKQVDLAIVEPTAFTKEQLQEVQASGTLLIGYISVMEAPVWNVRRMQRLQEEDYYQPQGRKIHFAEWDSYLMDLRQPGYRSLLLSEVQESIIDKGLDGIFLDTVGDIDDYVTSPGDQRELRAAYRTWLQQLHGRTGSLPVIQNRGFDTLEHAVPYIQGVLWEDWKSGWERDAWTSSRVGRLLKEQKRGLKVFTVSSSFETSHGKAARKLRFVHLDVRGGYHEQAY